MPLIIVQTPVHAGALGQLLPSSTPVDVPLALGFDLVGRGAAVWVTRPDFDENPPPVAGGGNSAVGPYANTTALQTAHPAAANTGRTAYVGASAPYTLYQSNGSAWVAAATSPVSSVAGRTGAVTLTEADVGPAAVIALDGPTPLADFYHQHTVTVDFADTELTVAQGLAAGFRCRFGGTNSILLTPDVGVTVNGAGTSITLPPVNGVVYELIQTAADTYTLTDLQGGAVEGFALWLPNTFYTAGQLAVHPETGSIVAARTTHASGSVFDGRRWIFPSSEGDTVFDFTRMSDRPVAQVFPLQGVMNYGTSSAANTYGVYGGRFGGNPAAPPTGVIYFEGELLNSSQRVQHMWIVFDVDANPSDNNQITFILNEPANPSPGTVGAIVAGIHWDFFPRLGASYAGRFGSGPYPGGLAGIPAGPVHQPYAELRGKTVRYDLVLDSRTGMCKAFVNGRMIIQYGHPNIPTYTRHKGIFEINSGSQFYVQQFGVSAKIPEWATDGSARGVAANYNPFSPVTDISSTDWLPLYEFNVAYDDTGEIEVRSSPYIKSTGASVQMQVRPANYTQAQLNANNYPVRMCSGAINARLMFASGWIGTPGTTERIAIWIKANAAGASVDNNFDGQGHTAWAWCSTSSRTSIGV